MNDNPENPVIVTYHIEWAGQGASDRGTFEIPRVEWDQMTPAQRRDRVELVVAETVASEVGSGWHIYDQDYMAATEEQP
jgi:hypothetical protein